MEHIYFWLERGGAFLGDFDHLATLFPYTGILYRGRGFDTKKDYVVSLKLAQAGTYKSDKYSSWSTKLNIATKFTHTTLENCKWPIRGFVIQTKASGVALFRICECFKATRQLPSYLSFLPAECEVALPPGKYEIIIKS